MNDEHYPFSRGEDKPDTDRFRIFKNRGQWRWLQWIHRGLVEDRWSKRERYLAERKGYNRSHLGGVFITRNSGLGK